jgi:two-component system response regulator GlrR
MTTSIFGKSTIHAHLLELVASAATTDAEVLIHGPSGVGKELYARRIHELSARARAHFVPVNCGAIPAELFENELFGHAGGAFTGARTRSAGLVAEAHRGTLFLDEVDALPLASQVKLLRFIQQKEYRPLGDSRLRHSDARIIAATNADLLAEVKQGRFRCDLFFRLRVLPLHVPPLKERREDIPVLLEHFMRRYEAEYGKPRVSFSPEALQQVCAYDWPGNIRELENCARYLLCTHGGRLVQAHELPLLERPGRSPPPYPPASASAFLARDIPGRQAPRRLRLRAPVPRGLPPGA